VILLSDHSARQGFFEPGEFEAVCDLLPMYLQDFTCFAYLSGWRTGEVASLTWADADRDTRSCGFALSRPRTARAACWP